MSASDPAETIEFPLIMFERIVALGAVPVTTDLQSATAVNRLFRQLMTLLSSGAVDGLGWASSATVLGAGVTPVAMDADGRYFTDTAMAPGAITLELPAAAGLRDGWNISACKSVNDGNAIAIAPNGADIVIGPTSIRDPGASLFVVRASAGTWRSFACAPGQPGAAQAAQSVVGATPALAAADDGGFYNIDATGASSGLLLPDPATVRPGWNVIARRHDASANAVTVAAAAGTINGPASLYGQNDALVVVRTSATTYATFRIQFESRNNYTATTDPGPNNDVTEGYGYWSRWANTATGELFACSDPTAGAAVWMSIGGGAAPPAMVNNGARLHRMPGNISQGTAGVYSTAISVPVAANSLYMIEYVLNYQNTGLTSTTTIARMGLPAGATAWGVLTASQGTSYRIRGIVNGLDTLAFGHKGSSTPTPLTAMVVVQTGANAGNVNFEFTVGGATTTTFLAGGTAVVRDLDAGNISVVGAGGLTASNISDWRTLATVSVPANTAVLIRSALNWNVSGSGGPPRFRVAGAPSDCIVTLQSRRHSTSDTNDNSETQIGGRLTNTASNGSTSGLWALQYLSVRTRDTPATIELQFASNAAAQSCTMLEGSLVTWRPMGSQVTPTIWNASDAAWESAADIAVDAAGEYLAFGTYQWMRATAVTANAHWRINPVGDLVAAIYFANNLTPDQQVRTDATATSAMSPADTDIFGCGFDAVFSGGGGGNVSPQVKLSAAGGQVFVPSGNLTLVEELTLVP